MIIDSHTHVDEVEAWGWFDPPEVLLPLLDEPGIDQAVIMTYRDAIGPDDPATAYLLSGRTPATTTSWMPLPDTRIGLSAMCDLTRRLPVRWRLWIRR